MATNRLLHLLRAPASSPAAHIQGAHWPQRVSFLPSAAGMRSVAVACSISRPEQDGMTYKGAAGVDEGIDDYYVTSKLKLAVETGIHDTVGIDLVAMGVNDILTTGAKPAYLVYGLATRKLDLAEEVIKGIVNGCEQSDCVKIGSGGTEVPDSNGEGEYVCCIALGVVRKDKFIDGRNIVEGDMLLGLPSSGLHSNGFSLARRALDKSGLCLTDQLPRNDGITTTVGEALMAPSVLYVNQVLEIISKGGMKGLAHITGGGFTDCIPRVFPSGLGAKIFTGSWEVPPVFKWIQQVGKIEETEMMRTFNMGVGMVLVVSKEAADRIIKESSHAYHIGEVVQGEGVHYV